MEVIYWVMQVGGALGSLMRTRFFKIAEMSRRQ